MSESNFWVYENDVGNPVPYARIHHDYCPAGSRRRFEGDLLATHNRWIGPFDTYDAALSVALKAKTNVWRCKQCEWHYL